MQYFVLGHDVLGEQDKTPNDELRARINGVPVLVLVDRGAHITSSPGSWSKLWVGLP